MLKISVVLSSEKIFKMAHVHLRYLVTWLKFPKIHLLLRLWTFNLIQPCATRNLNNTIFYSLSY